MFHTLAFIKKRPKRSKKARDCIRRFNEYRGPLKTITACIHKYSKTMRFMSVQPTYEDAKKLALPHIQRGERHEAAIQKNHQNARSV